MELRADLRPGDRFHPACMVVNHSPLNLGSPSLFDTWLKLFLDALKEQTSELRAIRLRKL